VNGHAARIDGSHARGRYDDHSFGRFLLNLVQKGGFSGACFSCQENVFVRVAHIIESEFELWIRLEGHSVFSWGFAWLNDIRMYGKVRKDATKIYLQFLLNFLF